MTVDGFSFHTIAVADGNWRFLLSGALLAVYLDLFSIFGLFNSSYRGLAR